VSRFHVQAERSPVSSRNEIIMPHLLIAFLIGFTSLYAEPIDFSRDIRPILNANCTGCHGGVKKNGNVSFLYREQVIAKGKSGKPTVVPGDSADSEMYRRITTDDPDDIMPQPDHGPPLKAREIALIKQWIDEGAQWNNHWSFEKPLSYKAPEVSSPSWLKNKIDPFILAKLDEAGLTPSAPATYDRLLRRIHLDLTGYPPTIAQLDAFEKTYSEDPDTAVLEVVNRLLDDKAFGEKWATQWLDVARYADSEGLGADRRWNVWPYRDWVIRALNGDMPYNDFLTKQIAGDLLPNASFEDLIATNYHRLTQQNQEGGTDNEEFRTMAVMDRVNATWEGLQGITFACVQCHDHPYDPIRHDEYYKFLSFFNSTRDLDLASHYPTIRVPDEPGNFSEALELKKKAEALQTKLQDQARELIAKAPWTKIDTMTVTSTKVGSTTRKVDGFLEYRTEGTIPRHVVFTLDIPKPAGLDKLTALRIHTLPLDIEKAKHSGDNGAILSHITLHATLPGTENAMAVPLQRVISDDDFPEFDPNESLKKGSKGWGARTHQYHPRSCVVVLKEPLDLPEGTQLRLALNHNDSSPTAPLATKRGRVELSDFTGFQFWLANASTQADLKILSATKTEYQKLGKLALPIMANLPPTLARATHLFKRGNWLEKGPDALNPATPASLPPLGSANPTRLDLAKWLVSQDNPFTSRVVVSRIWAQIFGTGLVETLEDFGSSGLPPSHPLLLDDLSVRFQTELKWSVKSLLREILTSATYRQSSAHSSIAVEKDPFNQLLSHGPRNRLSAEHIRDHHLAVSGLLTNKLYGAPVRPPIAAGVWKPFSDGPWNAAKVGDPNRYRRSIYTYRKRSIPHPTMDAFDSPTRETCSARRLSSNTPLGALATLNDEGFSEMAQALARRMKYDTKGDLTKKITTGFRLATSLKPNERQMTILTKLYHDTFKDFESNPKDYDGLAGTPDGAAYTIIASTLLNMDDALTK